MNDHINNSDSFNITDTTNSRKDGQVKNIVYSLSENCINHEDRIALNYRVYRGPNRKGQYKLQDWESITYRQFGNRINEIIYGMLKFHKNDIKKGDRILVLYIPASQADAIALMFACMYLGIVIIWLDIRTMTVKQMISNVENLKPKLLLASKTVQRILRASQVLFRRLKQCIQIKIDPKVLNYSHSKNDKDQENDDLLIEENFFPMVNKSLEDYLSDHNPKAGGVIMFTTGSTGVPKPVRLTDSNLAAQANAYRQIANDFQMPNSFTAVHSFINFNALDLALGNSTVTMVDPGNPKNTKGEWLLDIDERFRPAVMNGSRVIYENLCNYIDQNPKNNLKHIQYAFTGGAPIDPRFHTRVINTLPSIKEIVSAYACTEGLPLMTCNTKLWTDDLIEKCYNGQGILLGKNCLLTEINILKYSKAIEIDYTYADDENLKEYIVDDWQGDYEAEIDEVGELLISSPCVSPYYVDKFVATRKAKFNRLDDKDYLMHRTGDLASKDKDGNIWLMGRISQAIVVKDNIIIPPLAIESCMANYQEFILKRVAFIGIDRNVFIGAIQEHPYNVELQDKISIPVLILNLEDSSQFDPIVTPKHVYEYLKSNTKYGELISFDENAYISNQSSLSETLQSLLEGNLIVMNYDKKDFPFDLRHNSKIKRDLLAKWAIKTLKQQTLKEYRFSSGCTIC